MEVLVELLIRREEGVQVPAQDYVEVRKLLLQLQQRFLQLLDFWQILLLVGVEMGIDEDDVVHDHQRSLVSPHQAGDLLLAQHSIQLNEMLEGRLLDSDDRVMRGVSDMLVLCMLLDVIEEGGREFLKEDDIRLKLQQAVLDDHHLLGIIEIGKVVKLLQVGYVLRRVLLHQLLKGVQLVHIAQECMVKEEVIGPSIADMLVLKIELFLLANQQKLLIPSFLKLLLPQKPAFLDSDIEMEGRRVSAQSDLLLDLPHLPLKRILLLQFEVLPHYSLKDLAESLQFVQVGIAVKLERVVHDAAVVQRHNLQLGRSRLQDVGLLSWLRLLWDLGLVWLKFLHK